MKIEWSKWIWGIIIVIGIFWFIGTLNNEPEQLTSQGKPVVADQKADDLYRTTFLEACYGEAPIGGGREYCRCVYNGIEMDYTEKEREKLFETYNETEMFPDNINTIVEGCIYHVL